MDLIDIIGFVGSITSIWAAIWAAMIVGVIKKTKNEIFARLRIVKYTELKSSSDSVISQLRKIANKSRVPRGTNFESIIDGLNTYFEGLNSIRNEISNIEYPDKEEHLIQLKDRINSASNIDRTDPKHLIRVYTEIYYHILEIDS